MRASLRRRATQVALAAAVLAFGSLVAHVPAAAATPQQPVATVGTNINLSQGLGNQFEGSVAIDPADPQRMFVLGRDETGNLIGARSSGGGATWTHAKMGTSQFSADRLPAAWGNTSVTFDGFGNLFVVYLGPIPQTYATFALSTDGGVTFSHQAALANLTDQPVVAAGDGTVWVTYNRGGVNVVTGAAVTGLGVMGAFGAPEVVPGANAGAFGDMAVGPAGQVMVAFGPLGASGDVLVSVDPDGLGPAGFSTAAAAAHTNVGGFTDIPVAPNWGIDSEAHLAWDKSTGPHRGRVSLAYLDSPIGDPANTSLYVKHSDDAGNTWSTAVRVDDDGTDASHVMPGFAVDQTTGALAATWYDTRNDPSRATTQYFGAVSFDGGTTWSANFQISAGVSNQAGATPPAPIRDTDYGDYTGLAFDAGVMVPVWADNSNSTGDNPAGTGNAFDLYTALVSVTPPAVPPVVTTEPSDQFVAVGTSFAFSAAASGSPPPSTQWQVSDNGGSTFVDVPGATDPTFVAVASRATTATSTGPCSSTPPAPRHRPPQR